jgi:hypothetical protein
MMKARHPLVWVLGFTAFAMNPAFACSSSPETEPFEYGEAEMIAAVQGTWRLTYARPEGASTVTFTVQPGSTGNGALAGPPGLAPQCGTRTFTRPAAACISASQLALAASVVEADPPLDASAGRGFYTVFSIKYIGGQLELTFGTNLRMSADVDMSNAIRQSYVDWQGARVTSVLERASAK